MNILQADIVNHLAEEVHSNNRAVGWWNAPDGSGPMTKDHAFWPYVIGTKLCLTHSEISEGMEGHRKSKMDDHLPHRTMFEVELADAVIRILDLAGAEGVDLGGAIMEKLAYNKVRQDHKLEARETAGGKKY